MSFIVGEYAYFYFLKELEHKAIGLNRLKQFNILFNLFILAMLVVASTTNIIVMWISLEATTIFTTFLISFYGTKTSWEASWKYVILCSV
jgi:hydrogenase-4 component F